MSEKPKMNLLGQDGNIFAIMGSASRLLKNAGQKEQASEMSQRVMDSHSYEEALGIISEYVQTELSQPSKSPQKLHKKIISRIVPARRSSMTPKLIYICAPLRGDINANIEAARLHAKRVFEQGDAPVCPHLMFPPVADPSDPDQDRQAMEMCLQVLARCDQINVYGDEYTAGMCEEIAYAHQHGIPINYKPMKRGRTQRQPNRPQQSLCH